MSRYLCNLKWAAPLGLAAMGSLLAWWLWPVAGPVPKGHPTAVPEGAAWIDLLAPERQAAWKNITDDKDIFEIQENVLHIFGHTLYPLRYVCYESESFEDFALHVELRVAPGANSGVFLRAQPNDPVYRGFEVQVLDDHGAPPHKQGSGAIYDVVTPMFNMARPAGEWNSLDITVQGGEVIVLMNGWMIVHTDLDKMTMPLGKYPAPFSELPRRGHLMFQDHGGEVWYRNVRLMTL